MWGFSADSVTSDLGTVQQQQQQPSAVISGDGAEQQVQMEKIHFLVELRSSLLCGRRPVCAV